MAVQKANYIWRDFETDGVSASGFHKPINREIRERGTWVENAINAGLSNGGLIYDTRANMNADLAHPANSSAWVIGDAVAANNGIYRKSGAPGTGSWTRIADLPFSFIRASNSGAGTANGIWADTAIPIPTGDGGALITVPVVVDNTGSPVRILFNGGAVLTIKSSSGNDIAPGGLKAGMVIAGYVAGDTFRLLTDQASAAIQIAAEAAASAAQGYRDQAQAYANIASGVMTTVIDPQFATRATAQAYSPALAPDYIRTSGYAAAGDGGGALYKKVGSEPAHRGKLSITLSGGGTAWYEVAQHPLNIKMLGGGAGATASQNGGALNDAATITDILEVDEAITASGVDQVATRNLALIGDGSANVYRKPVIPRNAPSDALTEIGIVPAVHCQRLSAASNPIVALVGDSISTYAANSLGRQNMLTEAIQEHLDNQFGSRGYTFANRAIGGSVPEHFIVNTDGSHGWDSSGPATWASYVKALVPDMVIISWGMNPGTTGSMSYTALNAVVTEILSWPKVPDIIFCTPLVPSLGGLSSDGTKADQESRDMAAGMVRTYALKNGYGLLDFHRKACMVRDGFDPWNSVLKKGDTVAASGGTCLGTKEVYDFRATIVFSAASWAAGGPDFLTVKTGPGTADFLQITRNGSGNWAFAMNGGILGNVAITSVPDSGVAMPQTTVTIVVEKYRNRIIVWNESVNSGSNTAPILDIKFIGYGGLFTPRINSSGSNVVLQSTAFRYGEPRLNRPSLTNDRMWGENFSGGAGDYGGNAWNHPSGWVTSHVYRPLLMLNPFIGPTDIKRVVSAPSGKNLTAADSGTLFQNQTASAVSVFNLPSAHPGLTYGFMVLDTDGIRVVAQSGQAIRIGTGVSSTNRRADSTEGGAVLWLTAFGANAWGAETALGTWTLS